MKLQSDCEYIIPSSKEVACIRFKQFCEKFQGNYEKLCARELKILSSDDCCFFFFMKSFIF